MLSFRALPVLALGLVTLVASPLVAQPSHQHHAMPQEENADSKTTATADASVETFLMQQSSGTSTQPSSWPMPMLMTERAGWQLGLMGQAYLVRTQQSGPRGDDATYSVNWLMLSANRPVGPGRLQFRVMTSLEPATVGSRRYPLLFQTGESAYGRPLVDGQHPHDLFMELSVQYAWQLRELGIVNVYFAPVGDAALGPVAFPHRASAMELPQATLGHHWQDSTHIANTVITAGWSKGPLRLEASGFHGGEPDEDRWDLDFGAIDSWSVRTSLTPHANWMGQVSFGRLRRPEAFHADDVDRTTASLHHVLPRAHETALATSVIWATNRKSLSGERTHAVTLETLVPFARTNHLNARLEWSQRDELFENDHELAHEIAERTGKTAFDVTALTVGYTRDVLTTSTSQVGVGGTITRYWTDGALAPYYGSSPWGASVFIRVRARGQAH